MLARAGEPALLLIAPTGAGKTMAGFLPTLAELADGPARRPPHPLRLAAQGARRRHPAQPPAARRGAGAADPRRGPHRRHHAGRAAAAAARPAPHPADHARVPRAAPLSYEDAPRIFAGLERVIVDEIHALAESKRGDQLFLALSRLEALAPGLRRVGLSATVDDPDAIARLLARNPDPCAILFAAPGPRAGPVDAGDRPPAALGRGRGAPRHPAGAGGGAAAPDHAHLPQHPRAGRGVLPPPLAPERRGPPHRHPPRLPRARAAGAGRGGDGGGRPQGHRLHRARSTSASTGATWTS